MSAEQRRDEILDAAMAEFARHGLYGTATDRIAERVGVSQPYLFRLFGTKKELFLATVQRGFDTIATAFRGAVREHPEGPLEAMGEAYSQLLAQREQLLLQMQAYAACGDEDVQRLVRDRFAELYHLVEDLSGASDEDIYLFFASGMLLNVAATLNLPSIITEEWTQKCLSSILGKVPDSSS